MKAMDQVRIGASAGILPSFLTYHVPCFVVLMESGIVQPNIDCLSRLEAFKPSTMACFLFRGAHICNQAMKRWAKATSERLTGRPVLGVSRNRPCWSVGLGMLVFGLKYLSGLAGLWIWPCWSVV